MCGIFGVVYNDRSFSISDEWLRKTLRTMAHRGPDDEGVLIQGHVGLAHRRLSIIDLSGGHQPMSSDDGVLSVTFNGEIYNYQEIRAELIVKGYCFKSESDTEVILHAYREYGTDCLNKFRGMFAFALYDRNQDILFLARDRLGKKPLYYYVDGQVFAFSSEVKGLLGSGLAKSRVNMKAMDFYLSLGYVPAPLTMFEGISKLNPGCYLLLERGRLSIHEYWKLEETRPQSISFNDACMVFYRLLEESVKTRLISEVPLGLFLSGGVDSSAVLATMTRILARPVKTFSVGYKNASQVSELPFARKIANYFKADHHEYILTPVDFFDSLANLLKYTEEPIVESAGVALYQLAKLARSEVTVVLSGEGADEILAGYPMYSKMLRIEQLSCWTSLSWLAALPVWDGFLSEKLKKYRDWFVAPLEKRYFGDSCDLTSSTKKEMYSSALQDVIHQEVETCFEDLYHRVPSMSYLGKMQYVDVKTWLADDLLLKADKMTMAASVELRTPFLDHHLVEFAFSLPDKYKLSGATGKFLLKKVMEPYLPREIIYRRKQGFPVPIASWFKGELYEPVYDLLMDHKTRCQNYFKPSYVETMLKNHKAGRQDMSRRIFSLLTLELWHRLYVDP